MSAKLTWYGLDSRSNIVMHLIAFVPSIVVWFFIYCYCCCFLRIFFFLFFTSLQQFCLFFWSKISGRYYGKAVLLSFPNIVRQVFIWSPGIWINTVVMKVVKLVMVVDDYEIGDPVEKSPWTYYYVSIGISTITQACLDFSDFLQSNLLTRHDN